MGKLELQQMVLGPVYTNCYFLKNKETGRFTEENFSEGGRYGCKAGRNPSDSWPF